MSGSPSRPSVLHVIVRAGATNSQYNEHCLPVLEERDITVCSLFPAEVAHPVSLRLVEGDGTARGCTKALRRALALGPYDIVHVHAPASGVLTLWVYLTARMRRRNLVFTVHNSWANFRRRNRAFLYLILALFPTVVVCGKAAGDSMPRVLRRLVRRKLRVVQNGVDVDRIDRAVAASAAAPVKDSAPLVLSVNRLIPLKDPRTVLNAFVRTRVAGSKLVFVGEGQLRPGMATDVLHGGLRESVGFTGLIDRDRVYALLATADVFVTASRGEGLPVAVLEAMACGCPVILSDIPPHREIARVAHGVPLVPTGDVEGFARATRRVLALEPAERRELGQRQRQCVIEHFSVRAMNNAYGEIYMHVIERNRRRRKAPQQVVREPLHEDENIGLPARMQRRYRLVIALTLVGATGGFGFSLLQVPEYHAEASLLVGDVIGGPADEDSLNASATLASSYADLTRREPVLEPVAELGFADNWRQLQQRVHAQTGDKNPQLVQVTATASTRWEAEDLAAAVAEQVVTLTGNREVDEQSEFAKRQLGRLEDEILSTQARIEQLQVRIDGDPDAETVGTLTTEVADLREHLSVLQVQYDEMLDQTKDVSNRADVEVLEHAYAAPSPLRPDSIALAAAGGAAGFALAAGWIYLAARRRRPAPTRGGNTRSPHAPNGHHRRPQPGPPAPWAEHDQTRAIEPKRREGKGR